MTDEEAQRKQVEGILEMEGPVKVDPLTGTVFMQMFGGFVIVVRSEHGTENSKDRLLMAAQWVRKAMDAAYRIKGGLLTVSESKLGE